MACNLFGAKSLPGPMAGIAQWPSVYVPFAQIAKKSCALLCEKDKHGYRQTTYISGTLTGNWIVDNSDVVGASPVGAAPTTFSFST